MNIFRWYRDADYSSYFFILLRVALFWITVGLAHQAGAPEWALVIIALLALRL